MFHLVNLGNNHINYTETAFTSFLDLSIRKVNTTTVLLQIISFFLSLTTRVCVKTYAASTTTATPDGEIASIIPIAMSFVRRS